MNHVPIKLGPLALLLTVVSICLSILAILTLSTARADMALAEKYAETVQIRYALEAEGQKFLANAEPGTSQMFEKDGMRLIVALDDKGDVVRWTIEKQWDQSGIIGGLWTGN